MSEWFESQGGLNREAGEAFREAILAPGYSVDPMTAIEKFFGVRPDVAPLLRRRGLAEPVPEDSDPSPAGDPAPAPKHHANNTRIAEILTDNGIEPQITVFSEATPTAASAAEKVGVDVGAIANSLVFSAGGDPVLIMTSGAHRVDTDHVASLIGVDSLDRADKDLVRAATGQVIGGVAPIGHPAPIPTFIDTALRDFPVLWAAAGTPQSMMPLTYDQLVTLTGGKEIAVVADES
ncbi:YbaK/prolyl-tRNA synthetase associated domain-containing protein [Mycobacteroides abscessus subsp. abscessus]|nr:YbaK/prolyl-tRNA synthetase associated domain-containing protein [Mycobacteroides abscessus subsp. abscessus]